MPNKKTPEKSTIVTSIETVEIDLDVDDSNFIQHSSIELDEELVKEGADTNLIGSTKKLGGPTGGDFEGGGKGPALGAKHAADDSTADHYGSREETNAALEEKIAVQNSRRLHGHLR